MYIFMDNMVDERQYFTETIIDAHFADDLVIFANTPAQAKYLQHSLKLEAIGIGLYIKDKTKFMHFNQDGAISSGNGELVCLCVGISRRMSLPSLFLLFQLCPVYPSHLTWMVCEKGGKWLYNYWFQ